MSMRERSMRFLTVSPLLALGVLTLVVFLIGATSGVFVSRALEYGEPYVVSASWELSQGRTLYADVHGAPWLHNNYNPLVQSLMAPALWVTGPSYVPFRALSWVATLAVLALLFVTARRLGAPRPVAFLASTLPLSGGFVYPWMFLARVDSVALLLAVATFVLGLRTRDATGWRRGLFLFTGLLAFLAKQSMLAATAAVLLDRFLRGDRKGALIQGVLFSALVLLSVFGLQLLTDGEYWRHAMTYNASHERVGLFSSDNLGRFVTAMNWPLLVLFAAALPWVRFKRDAPVVCWVFVSLAAALWMASKSGSHVHYYQETACAASLLVTLVLSRLLSSSVTSRRRCLMVFAVGMIASVLAVPAVRFDVGIARRLWRERTVEDPLPAAVRKALNDANGPLLLLYPFATHGIESGKSVTFDLADFVRLRDLSVFDVERDLLPSIASKRFAVIALPEWEEAVPRPFQLESLPGLSESVRTHYEPLTDVALPPWAGKSPWRGTFFVPKR